MRILLAIILVCGLAANSAAAEHDYDSRLRFKVAERQKFGVETLPSLEHGSKPLLLAGYHGQLSKSWSVKLLAGATVRNDSQLAMRLVLTRPMR